MLSAKCAWIWESFCESPVTQWTARNWKCLAVAATAAYLVKRTVAQARQVLLQYRVERYRYKM